MDDWLVLEVLSLLCSPLPCVLASIRMLRSTHALFCIRVLSLDDGKDFHLISFSFFFFLYLIEHDPGNDEPCSMKMPTASQL